MKGDEVLVMTSLVIIFAVFLQRRRSFIQQMRLMSLQMRKMRRNLLILSIRQRNTFSAIHFKSICPLMVRHFVMVTSHQEGKMSHYVPLTTKS